MSNVIVLHRVSDREWFDGLVRYLMSRYSVVSIEALASYCETNRSHEGICHITVDDGDTSFMSTVLPVLVKYGVSASLFVSPQKTCDGSRFWFQEIETCEDDDLRQAIAREWHVPVSSLCKCSVISLCKAMPIRQIEKIVEQCACARKPDLRAPSNLTMDDLRMITQSGLVSIGAHTLNHPILANERLSDCKREIEDSVVELGRLLGYRVRHFAYPNGMPDVDFGSREETILRRIGIALAFTTEMGHLPRSVNRMRVPRIAIGDGESVARIRLKLMLGSAWNELRKIRRNGEYSERRRLQQMVRGLAGESRS